MKTKLVLYFSVIIIFFSGCLQDLPDSISSDIELNTSVAFPLGTTSLGLNEISGFDENLLQINPITGKPYWSDFEEVPLSYTMPFEIGDIYQTSEEIVKLSFRLNIYNGFPSSLNVQLYFLDPYEFPVDSIFSTGPITLTPAKANESGKIISKPHEKKDITLSTDRLNNLETVKKVMVYIVFSTQDVDDNLIMYYDDYKVDVQIGVKATLKFNP